MRVFAGRVGCIGDVEFAVVQHLEWISVEVDTHCNVRCTMCPISTGKVKNQGRVSLETIENICRKAKGWTDKISLAVMGEPLLHPLLPEMVALVKRHGYKALVWTNGVLMNRRRAEALLRVGVDKVVFSFEIIDKDLHEAVRVGASYDKVRANLDAFLELRDALSPATEVSIWNIIPDLGHPLTVPESLAAAYPGVEFFVSYAMDWHGEVDVGAVPERLGAPAPCNQIQHYLSVAWDGKVIACCNDFNHEYVLGDINTDSMEDIWYGKPRSQLVERMARGLLQGVRPCGTCSAPYVKEGVPRYFVKDRSEYTDKMASNAAKQVDGEIAGH